MEWGALLAWIGGIASTITILILKAHLEARIEERRTTRTTSLEERQRQIETDRSVYGRRHTALVHSSLATFVRSGEWWLTGEEFWRLVESLEQDTYEDFVDPEVNALWVELIAMTAELARKRLAQTITPEEILRFNQAHRAWEDAAKRSFGPLPEIPGLAPGSDRTPPSGWRDSA